MVSTVKELESQEAKTARSPKRVVLAEFFVTNDDQTVLFVVRSDFDKPEVIKVKKSQQELRNFVIEYFSKKGNKGKDEGGNAHIITTVSDKVKELDEQSFQNFFQPFVVPLASVSAKGDLISNEGDIIWFVPHDVLHYIPLHAIKIEGRYLIERNPVCYTPSASVMKYCHKKRKEQRNKILVFGDSRNDLMHAREEAFAVAKLFNTTAFVGSQATKSLLKQKLSGKVNNEVDILHFCCHGKFDVSIPLKSHIVLAPEAEDEDNYLDGKSRKANEQDEEEKWNLTAEELFGMELNLDLVTLSACESGVNDRRPGDELIGLTRSLIYAGTPSVVVSLWSVDDLSTSLLMQRFYEELQKPNQNKNVPPITKAEALQIAQQYVRNLTWQEVQEYCSSRLEQFRQEGQDSLLLLPLLEAKANASIAANDHKAAVGNYQQILNIVRSRSLSSTTTRERYARIADNASRHLKAIENSADSGIGRELIRQDSRPFEQIYYWAPFIVVGDWK